MIKANRELATRYAPVYADFFSLLLEEKNLPLLFHCTAGKDRTGFAAALLLSALGVCRDWIYADYLASNYFRREENIRIIRKARLVGIPSHLITPVMEVRAEYLEAAFEEIEKEYENVENYLHQVMGLNAEKIQRLRELYLE
ncbi:MAG: tyrosine-protein phosphatase [Microscillaceae bacterium]|nr:tyrosine-protein phosphatase [Microscillaceae bacterium]